VIALSKRFDVDLLHLMPILASLLFGLLCTFSISLSSMEIYSITPFPEGVSGSVGNAFYFVILSAVGALLVYLLLKRKSRTLITLITGFALTASVFTLSFVYLSAAFSFIPHIGILMLSILIAALADFAIFRFGGNACNVAVIFLGGALGSFLGVVIPTLSAVLILVFLAVYDTIAVYYGPVGKIARIGLDQLRGLTLSFRNIQIGLGDLTFYSMLSGHMLFNFGVVSCFISVCGILTGCLLAFGMLEKLGIFPGLPFPIFLGIATGLLASLI